MCELFINFTVAFGFNLNREMMKIGCLEKWMWGLLAVGLFSCSGGGNGDEPQPEPQPEPETEAVEIKLNVGLAEADAEGRAASRATDVGFEAGDAIGLYVVNYADGQAGTLQNSGNHADNAEFTYDAGKWTPKTPIYWQDEETRADFYVYYPRVGAPTVAGEVFAVKADQSALEDYKASDFLWGKTAGAAPSEEAVNVTVRHVMSCVRVKVTPGGGFTEEELAAADIQARVNHVMTEAKIDLSTGVATAQGGVGSVTLGRDGEYFRALVVPQTVDESDLVTVTVDGREFHLTRGMTFEANKRYTCTVEVTKTSEGVNVSIGDWEDDGFDYGGIAE